MEAIEHSMHFYQHCCYRSPKLIFADPQDDLVLLGAATVAIDKVLSDPNRYFPSGSRTLIYFLQHKKPYPAV